MSTSEKTEKRRVRERIREYYKVKEGYNFERFGKYEKINLGGRTGLYIVETIMIDHRNYALVTVNRAFVQGIMILNSDQLSRIVKTLIDGLEKEFGN